MEILLTIIVLILFKRNEEKNVEQYNKKTVTRRKATATNWTTLILITSICVIDAVGAINTIHEENPPILFDILELPVIVALLTANALSFRHNTICIRKEEYDDAILMNSHSWWITGLLMSIITLMMSKIFYTDFLI